MVACKAPPFSSNTSSILILTILKADAPRGDSCMAIRNDKVQERHLGHTRGLLYSSDACNSRLQDKSRLL